MTEKQRQELCERFSQIFAVANPDPNVPFEKFIYDALLKAFIAGAEYAWNNPNWISVKDELPPENGKTEQSISVWATNGLTSGEFRYNFGTKTWTNMWGDPFDVTHWMPLPQPPRKEGKE